MKAALGVQLFPPETAAGARRTGALASALHEVCDLHVATVSPSYPQAELFASHLEQYPFAVTRLGPFAPHSRGLLGRALREILMSTRVASRLLRQRPGTVITSSPSMFLGPTCWVAARLLRARFVWDIRDLTWEYAREQARSSVERLLARWMASVMWSISRRADLVIAATDGIRAALLAEGLPEERVLVAPNSPSRTILAAALAAPEVETKLGRPCVLYAGLIGRNQGLDVLLDVAADSPNLDFEVAGDGPERSRLESQVRLRGLSNVTFLGFLHAQDLAAAYRRAAVLFATVCDTETLSRDSAPSKLLEYMVARRPIVYAGRGAAADALTRSRTAVVVPPTDRNAIAAAIDQLVLDSERRAQLVRRAWLHVASGPFREDVMANVAASIVELEASRRL